MMTNPMEQHAWLRRWVGQWTYEGECPAGPEGTPLQFRGAETVRMVGELWIIGEGTGEMPGGVKATTVMTVGYDPKLEKFVGSWIGSMSAYQWVYRGWLDEAKQELTLEAEGASFLDPSKTTTYRDITELVSDNERRFRAMMLNDKSEWQQIMSATYKRAR